MGKLFFRLCGSIIVIDFFFFWKFNCKVKVEGLYGRKLMEENKIKKKISRCKLEIRRKKRE